MIWSLLIGIIFLWAQTVYAQPYADIDSLKTVLAGKPDTVQIAQYKKYADKMRENGHVGDARIALTQALALAEKTKNPRQTNMVYLSLGVLEIDQGNFVQALNYFQHALDLLKGSSLINPKILTLLRIGQTYFLATDLKQAEHYYLQALQLARQYNQEVLLADTYSELANLEDTRKNSQKALAYNEKAIALYRANNEDYISALFNRAIEYKNAGQYAQSERIFRQCLQHATDHNDNYLKGYVYINLPNTLILMNRLNEAEHYARLALKWSESGPGRLKVREDIFDVLTRIYEKKSNARQALAFFRQKAMYRDSVLNAEKSRQLIMAESRYQAREKENQIRALDAENSQKAQQLGWLSGGLAILVLLLGILFWQYRIIRRTNSRLVENNRVISESHQKIMEQSGQLKILLQELHHRVKNNLAIVSSLLRLQARRLEDGGASQALQDGQQRVEAMALIHQRLYMTDKVSSVNMKEYITDLLDSLLLAYGYEKSSFDRDLLIEQEELDVDLSILLGLILNEILTNAFKYAYKDVQRPFIRIWLLASPSDDSTVLRPQLTLEVQDNGMGLHVPQWDQPSTSFGKRLIMMLSEQVGGQLEVTHRNGTQYRLVIPPLYITSPIVA